MVPLPTLPLTVERWDGPLDALATLWGPRLEAAGLYAQGNDFTNGFAAHEGYVGSSYLLRRWQGQSKGHPNWTHATLWVLHDPEAGPVGVVLWEHGDKTLRRLDIPSGSNRRARWEVDVVDLGGVSSFMASSHRQQGHMKRLFHDHVSPDINGQAASWHAAHAAWPYVAAQDATSQLLTTTGCTVEQIEFFRPCRNLDPRVARDAEAAYFHGPYNGCRSPYAPKLLSKPEPKARRPRAR